MNVQRMHGKSPNTVVTFNPKSNNPTIGLMYSVAQTLSIIGLPIHILQPSSPRQITQLSPLYSPHTEWCIHDFRRRNGTNILHELGYWDQHIQFSRSAIYARTAILLLKPLCASSLTYFHRGLLHFRARWLAIIGLYNVLYIGSSWCRPCARIAVSGLIVWMYRLAFKGYFGAILLWVCTEVYMRSMHDFRSIAGICTVLPGVCLLILSQCSAKKPLNGIFSVLPSYIFC